MHLIDRNEDASLKALLAERMRFHISCTNASPSCSVLFMHVRVTTVPLIVFLHQFPVFLAVPPIREARASWVSTGLFWLSWHCGHLLFARKRPAGFHPLVSA